MKIEWVTVGPFQENSYLVMDDVTRRAVLVDPGDEPQRIIAMVRAARATLDAIWLTHAHLDHVGAIAGVKGEWNVPVHMHRLDIPTLHRVPTAAKRYGLTMDQPPEPDAWLEDGQDVHAGSLAFRVHHLPGHAPGHVAFTGNGVMLGGDLLFMGSIGRTDLPGCDPEAMERSLATIATFDRDLVVYPGHGPPTTIGDEVETNPFLADAVGRA